MESPPVESASPGATTISNAADISVIIGYFILVISVGIWVSAFQFVRNTFSLPSLPFPIILPKLNNLALCFRLYASA
jgi:hypothetical protein